jgi:hypothetical protein
MTRDEFARYVFEGTEWTPATLAAARMMQDGMIPACDVETFEREVVRPDGVIPFRRDVAVADEYAMQCTRQVMWAAMEDGTFKFGDIT